MTFGLGIRRKIAGPPHSQCQRRECGLAEVILAVAGIA